MDYEERFKTAITEAEKEEEREAKAEEKNTENSKDY